MIQDFKPRLEPRTPSGLRRHRHKLVVAVAALAGAALFIKLAADPNDTTAAIQAAAPAEGQTVEIRSLTLPAAGSTPETRLSPAVVTDEVTADDAADGAADAVAAAAPDERPAASDDAQAAEPGAPLAQADDAGAKPDEPTPLRWVSHKVRSGESLARIFKEQGLSPQLLYKITHSSADAAGLARIVPGQTLKFGFDTDGELVTLDHVLSPIHTLRIEASDDGFATQDLRKDLEVRVAESHGTIKDSLFVDGQEAGLSDRQIMELAGIFGWDIDFALELRKGDSFSLVYQEQYLDGKKYRDGPILAAEFVNRGTSFRAIRYEDDDGNVSYYDADGSSKRRAFIRTPVKFARVSSRFTTKRWHPVLQKWRSHKGVDYAAPSGTPIKATGSGRVIFRGWKGGYGKVVIVQHGGKYTTLYGHMSRFNAKVKNGSRVKQGQIIGYVGQTGLATGPHLHYEFRINGVHRNPLTVKLPKSDPLPKAKLAAFRKSSAPLLAKLDALSPVTVVARADSGN